MLLTSGVCPRRPCGVVGLPVVVRFPAGPQVSLKCGDQSKDNGAGPTKNTSGCLFLCAKIQQDLITTTSRAPNVARGRLNSASGV